jgi:DNA-binding response OmpR family regulator
MTHLLVLEADPELRQSLEEHLGKEGFSLDFFETSREALHGLLQASSTGGRRPDAAILDLEASGEGLELLKAIRTHAPWKTLPVVLVTAGTGLMDQALDLGVDDHVSRPLSCRELAARLRGLLRRKSFQAPPRPAGRLVFEGISMDLERRTAQVEGVPLDLTRKEFDLLAFFLQNPRRVLSRERLLQEVWGLEYLGESRTIDAHVRRVRSKLGSAARRIETVVGVGYRMA